MNAESRSDCRSEGPSYLALLEGDRLSDRVAQAEAALRNCRLCGNDCRIDRTEQLGPCRIGDTAYVASYGPHHGEEDVLRGRYGSGTIFFSGCNLHCVYCQNADISQQRVGTPVSPPDLASMMLDLQSRRCHNVNLVSPTHVVPMIVKALAHAVRDGLRIPVVYNTGGYDTRQALRLMEGLADIYMPDMKYSDPAIGQALSRVSDYAEVNRRAVKEMHRQVGDLSTDAEGLAYRGLLVRHLVLPGGLAGTREIVTFLAQEVSRDTTLNLMAQYRPAYRARACATEAMPIDRPVSRQEYREALQMARDAGLHRFA